MQCLGDVLEAEACAGEGQAGDGEGWAAACGQAMMSGNCSVFVVCGLWLTFRVWQWDLREHAESGRG